ncbi:MAG: Ig-like domain-containing protein [Candidatus Babeliales bacterium]
MQQRLLLCIFLVVTSSALSNQQDGTLDLSFGSGTGQSTIANFGPAIAVAIQTDGKIVLATQGSSNTGTIIRLNPTGSLDESFSPVTIPLSLSVITRIIIQSDGKIVACGYYTNSNGAFLIRYTETGIFDTELNPSLFSDTPLLTMLQQADGKIIVGASGHDTGRIFRLKQDLTLDTIFDTTPSMEGGVVGITIQSDGKIVGLSANRGGSPIAMNLFRYNPNGTLDTSFGENNTGLAVGPVVVSPQSLAIQADGKIIASGIDANSNCLIARFTTSGILDTISYNHPNGFNNTVGTLVNTTLILQADGKAVVGSVPSSENTFQLARYNTNGIVDISFGSSGVVQAPAAGGVAALALQPDGNIVAVGADSTLQNAFIVRYLSSPAFVTTQINSPTAKTPLSVGKPITFSGQAQDPSLVFLFIDGVLQGGSHTDPNNWSIAGTVNMLGTHTIQVVSVYQDGNVNIAADPILITAGPQPPNSFTGTVTKNEFLNKTECVLQATFTPSINPATTQYIIAQNGIVLEVIPATAPLRFMFCGSCKGNAFNGITVSAVIASGIVGIGQPLVIV